MTLKTKTFELSLDLTKKDPRLDIYGRIGQGFFEEGNDVKGISMLLREIPADASRLDIHIHSGGGSIQEGLGIYGILAAATLEKHTYVDGLAASMASILMLVAPLENRHISENAWVMIHEAESGVGGRAKELRRVADQTERFNDQMVGIYQKNTGLDESEVRSAMDAETWYTAAEAVQFGFANIIEEAMDIAAESKEAILFFSKEGVYQNMPSTLEFDPVLMVEPSSQEDKQKEDETLNLEELKEKHPDLYEAAMKEGKDSVEPVDVSEIAVAERTRITSILALSRPGVEDLVQSLAEDPEMTSGDAAIQVLAAIDANAGNVEEFNAAGADSNGVVSTDGDANTGYLAENGFDGTMESRAKIEWNLNHNNVKQEFLSQEAYEAYLRHDEKGLVSVNTRGVH